ncbi:MAG: hypothetical protein ACLRJV_18960 [Eubacteriales bacterium]
MLELLRGSTQRLGHSPSQGRCIDPACISQSSFQNWPRALRAAGLAGRRVGAECPQSRCLRRTRSTSRCSIKFEAWRNSWAESHTRRSCLRYAGN